MNELYAKKKLEQVRNEVVRALPVTPEAFTVVNLYQSAMELYSQGKYDFVVDICFALEKEKQRRDLENIP